jgi:hypothetical protein
MRIVAGLSAAHFPIVGDGLVEEGDVIWGQIPEFRLDACDCAIFDEAVPEVARFDSNLPLAFHFPMDG